jgi:hypothetical protein
VEILNLGGAAESNSHAPKSRKKLRVLLGIGALAAVTGIGSTLAANISLNGGGNVEFGQGVATTAACDDDITLTPISEFSNTEEDATFAMTAIQISGIDLTPEGWDVFEDSWAQGYTPGYYDNASDTYVDATWTGDAEGHSGQYKNYGGVWTNTCANKSLMVRGYTDNSAYANRTADNSISSPLLLNGYMGQRPNDDTVGGFNSGVGFRYVTYASEGWGDDYWYIADCDYDCESDPLDLNVDLNGDNLNEDSTVTIYLDEDSYFPPLDSRWVDKLTVESAATTPSGWNDYN